MSLKLRSTCGDLQSFCEQCYQLFSSHRGLVDFHANDFFTHRLWERLDSSWVQPLSQATKWELDECLAGRAPAGWPASLVSLISGAQELSLPRQPLPQPAAAGAGAPAVPKKDGVKLKKQHEVAVLAALIATVAQQVGARTVVDLGAGKGHLAGELASRHGLSVLAVDVSDALVQHAGKQAQRGGGKGSGGSGSSSAGGCGRIHVAAASALLTASNAVPVLQGLLCQLQQRQQPAARGEAQQEQLACNQRVTSSNASSSYEASSNSSDGGGSSESGGMDSIPGAPLVLIGLHACGDLSPTVLRAFLEWPAAAAVVSLGCCYNLLTEQEPASGGNGGEQGAAGMHVPWHRTGGTGQCCTAGAASRASDAAGSETWEGEAAVGVPEPAGFPMSRHCQGRGMALGWAPRTAACHTNDRLLAAAPAGTRSSVNGPSRSSSGDGASGGSDAAPGAAAAVYRAALNRLVQLHCPEVPLSSISLGRSSRVKRRQARPTGTRAAVGAGAAAAAAAPAATAAFPEAAATSKKDSGDDESIDEHGCCSSGAGAAATPGIAAGAEQQGRPRGCGASAGATEAGFVQYVQGAAAKLGLGKELPGAEELAKFWREEVAPHAALLPALCMLRQVAGPLLESLILADRALFLLEPHPQESGCCGLAPSGPGPWGRGNLGQEQQPSQPTGCVPGQQLQAGGAGEGLEVARDEGQRRELLEDREPGGGCSCAGRQQQSGHSGPGVDNEGGRAGSNPVQATEGLETPPLPGGSLGLLGGVAASSSHVQCTLLPVFDPVVSPRNVAVIAVKASACSGCRRTP